MAKKTIYTDARYPEKINDLINNYGEINEKALEVNPVIEAKADLVDGKVPQSELPSYVDDVVEGYYVKAQDKFYEDAEHTIEIQGEASKIYVDLTASLSYRWSGSTFVQVNEVDLDDYYTKTATNALLDDKVDKVENKGLSSNDFTDAYKNKIDGLATVATTGSYTDLINKPSIPAEQIQSNWSQADNTAKDYIKNKPTIPTSVSQLTNDRFVTYDTAYQGLTTTQKSNARTNIGAGTSNFSGSYDDLTDKPTIPSYSAGTGISINNGVISLDIASGDNEGF